MAALHIRDGAPALDPSGVDVESIDGAGSADADDERMMLSHETVHSNSDKLCTPTAHDRQSRPPRRR
jgi:hypothetical protein